MGKIGLGRRRFHHRKRREKILDLEAWEEGLDTPNDRLAHCLIWLEMRSPALYEELRAHAASGGIRLLSPLARDVYNLLNRARLNRLQRKG